MAQRRRIIVRACIFLVLGAIINVGVAWAGCLWPMLSEESFFPIPPNEMEMRWWDHCGLDGLAKPSGSKPREGIALRLVDLRAIIPLRNPDRLEFQRSCGMWSGFPLSSMYGEFHAVPTTPSNWEYISRYSLAVQPSSLWPKKIGYLPLKPLWSGFAINTIFYAGILWMLFALPFAVRRFVRITRNQCASCGYSLHGIPEDGACPECGATR